MYARPSPAEKVSPEQLASKTRAPEDAPAATIDESLSATDLTVRHSEFTVNNKDGTLSMKMVIEEGTKRRGLYGIREGSLQFTLSEKSTLLIGLNNATYSREAGVVRVKGTLIGRIAEGGHYFKAEELSWDELEKRVSTKEVRYIGPGIDVTGKKMSIDMRTGEVTFDGPVDVGI